MTNAASAWPSATIAAAMSAPTSASVRPGCSHSPIRACTRSIAAPGRAQRVDLGGVLAHPQFAQHRAGERLRDVRERVAQREHVPGRHVVVHRDRRRPAGAGR